MDITLSRLHFPVTTLGYGKRIGVWFQGCSIGCKGCVSTDTWANDKAKQIELEALFPLLNEWLPEADGITVSGGEPFDQPDALYALLQFVREQTQALASTQAEAKPFSIFLYSGYNLEELQVTLDKLQSEDLVDAIMTEPFDEAQPQTKALRGSDNQRLMLLTVLGEQHFAQYDNLATTTTYTKHLDVMSQGDQAWLAGVPLQQDMPKIVDYLLTQGHDAKSTQKRTPNNKTRLI